jgi:hypothetical protein
VPHGSNRQTARARARARSPGTRASNIPINTVAVRVLIYSRRGAQRSPWPSPIAKHSPYKRSNHTDTSSPRSSSLHAENLASCPAIAECLATASPTAITTPIHLLLYGIGRTWTHISHRPTPPSPSSPTPLLPSPPTPAPPPSRPHRSHRRRHRRSLIASPESPAPGIFEFGDAPHARQSRQHRCPPVRRPRHPTPPLAS